MIFGRFVDESSDRKRLRSTVVAMYLCFAISLGLLGASTSDRLEAVLSDGLRWSMIGLAGVFLVLSLSAFSALKSATRRIALKGYGELDEQEQMIRGRAYNLAYQVLSWVTLLVVLYLFAAVWSGEPALWLPQRQEFGIVLGAFSGLVGPLPTAVVAWIGTDPTEEERS